MKNNFFWGILLGIASIFNISAQNNPSNDPMTWAKPVKNGIWLQPAQNVSAQPIWGFANGIRIGIAPMGGPRGLIRIYTPYLKHDEYVVTNFIALEPIVNGQRGLSELEFSSLDNTNGKRFWSSNSAQVSTSFQPDKPACGIINKENGKETLTVYFFCETFNNGADVYVAIKFTEGKPYEFEISGYSTEKSKKIDRFILTATMGNKARLRTLYLADGKTKIATDIWPDYRDVNFTPHDHSPLSTLIRDSKGGAWYIAAPNEVDPSKAQYHPETASHWKYEGKKATQYWYCPNPDKTLEGIVNGRYTYWLSRSPLPGGIAYENFELSETFHNGQRYVFGITPMTPQKLIKKITH